MLLGVLGVQNVLFGYRFFVTIWKSLVAYVDLCVALNNRPADFTSLTARYRAEDA